MKAEWIIIGRVLYLVIEFYLVCFNFHVHTLQKAPAESTDPAQPCVHRPLFVFLFPEQAKREDTPRL